MANWYLDHGCTLYPTAYMSTPASSASLPQEGDGKANGTGATPAVASASMDFTSATAAAGATLIVHGATLTCVASGASTNQFNAASGATLASNLASAINAATQAVTTTTGGLTSPYLKALVWAVASGAVLTIYTRIASADLNQSANASATISCGATANWTSPPATANFSGGVSGPWSVFFNIAALAAAVNSTVSGACTYGGIIATMMGSPAAGDVIHVRTGRAGSNITMTGLGSTAFTGNTRTVGNAASYLEIRFDNGTIWNDGNSNGVFTLQKDTTGFSASLQLNGYLYLRGQYQSGTDVQNGGVPNFKINHTATDSSGWVFTLYYGSTYNVRHTILERVEFADTNGGSWASPAVAINPVSGVTDAYRPARFVECKFGITRTNGGPFNHGGAYGAGIELVDCLFAFGGATTFTGALCSQTAPSQPYSLKLIRPKFTGGGGGHHTLLPFAGTMTTSAVLVVEDPIDMGQFIASDSAASFCGRMTGQTGSMNGSVDMGVMQTISSYSLDTGLLIDTPRRLIEWRNAGFPTTGISVLPSGTPYSLRFSVPHTGLATGLVNAASPQRGLKQIARNTLGDGTYTLTEHLLIDSNYGGSSYTPTDAEWWIEGTYVSSVDSSLKRFSTRGTGTNLTSDTQAWSTLSYAPFSGGSRSYSRWKIAVTLTNVKNDTIVACWPVCAKQPSTMNEWAFICPHPQLS